MSFYFVLVDLFAWSQVVVLITVLINRNDYMNSCDEFFVSGIWILSNLFGELLCFVN